MVGGADQRTLFSSVEVRTGIWTSVTTDAGPTVPATEPGTMSWIYHLECMEESVDMESLMEEKSSGLLEEAMEQQLV